ncbi:sigma-70 family RNA polymerase sigma factor, partial [Chitinophaga sp.]|uniref:sigma-70 family RNA polymerase sigma factor n=1 Tax=Chitinophaga sp. TaxID=1869181 RepID=UPI002C194314
MRKNQHISDADLLDLFRLGENDGTVLLYEKYYKGLVYFARQIVDHAGEAEDIVQECMVKLFNRRGDFEELSKIKSFLYVSVRNACLNYLKQQDRQRISQKELLYLTEKGDDTADHEMLKSR